MNFLQEVRTHNVGRITKLPLVESILSGKPNKEAYVQYLINVYNYAQHSPRVIALSASRCANSHPNLCRYLLKHTEEEIGHEHWVYSDLKDLGLTDQQIGASRPTAACFAMISLEYYVAQHWNPIGLFGWLYALESLGDAMGEMISTALTNGLKLGGEKKGIYFLQGHGVADHDHSADLAEQIEKNVTAASDLEDVRYIAEASGDLYARIIEESCIKGNQWV
jgi:hypothetical protein